MRKNRWRRWTAFLLAVCMSISLVLGTAQGIGAAAESSQSQEQLFNGIYYQTDDAGNAVITGMEGNFSVLDIPSSIDGYPVTAISESAFQQKTALKSVTIPDSVTTVGSSAFRGCTALKTIKGGSGITSAGSYIMEGTAWLQDQTDDVAVLSGRVAVSVKIGLKTAVVPDGVAVLCNTLFSDQTALTEVQLPASLTHIGKGAFIGCNALEKIFLPNQVQSVGASAFRHCTSLKSIQLPDELLFVGSRAFQSCSALETVQFNEKLQVISQSAFQDCTALQLAVLPESLQLLESSAFQGCTSLSMAVLAGSTLPEIPENAFSGCSMLEYVTMSNSVKKIGASAFSNCINLRSMTFPTALTEIGEYAFSMCTNLKNLTIPETVETVGKDAFFNSGWSLQQSSSWKICDGVLLEYCGEASEIVIPPTVRLIATGFLCSDAAPVSVTLPYGMIRVADGAFQGCETIERVIFSDSVTEIGNAAFQDCTSLKNLVDMNAIQTIGDNAFEGCTSLVNVVLPDTLTKLGVAAFRSCSGLTAVKFPVNLTELPEAVFYKCVALSTENGSMDLSNSSLQIVGGDAFGGCENLDNLTFPACFTTLSANAFYAYVHKQRTVTFSGNACTLPDEANIFPRDTVLRGQKNSPAQTYAEKYSLEFQALPDETPASTTTARTTTTIVEHTTKRSTSKIVATAEATTKTTPVTTVTLPPYITVPTTLPTTTTESSTTEWKTIPIPTGTTAEASANTTTENATTTTTVSTAPVPVRYIKGNVDRNASIDSTDLFLILYASARIGAGYPILTDGTLSDWEIESMDVNGDGTIAADDAYAVLLYCGLESVGKHPTSLDDFDWENNNVYTG